MGRARVSPAPLAILIAAVVVAAVATMPRSGMAFSLRFPLRRRDCQNRPCSMMAAKKNAPTPPIRKTTRTPIPTEPPQEKWREQMEGIRSMRRSRDAAVDFAGAGALKDSSAGSEDDVRFQVLMSAMLSSQTKDPVTAAGLNRMRQVCAPAPLGAAALLATGMDEDALTELLHPVSFKKTKAKHILMVCKRLAEAEDGRQAGAIPDTVEGLLALPGVGPKMTYLVMDVAWGRNEGICVDTHVHRISNRLGWVDTWNRNRPKAQNPEKTRKHLQGWLPREHWSEVNELLVGFGQQVCFATSPSCSTCGISGLCPSADRHGDLALPPSK
ncbi:unnamed protein product [Ectocarpus sp. 4 AP-2014]